MKPFLINYYFSEKLYRLGYITLSFFFFFQLFFTYKREILYIITNQLNYPYFIAYSVADLFFINISLAFFLTIIINLPYIYLQYLLYNKTTYTKTNQDLDEFVELMPTELSDSVGMVWSGKITDVKSIIGILWADRLLN